MEVGRIDRIVCPFCNDFRKQIRQNVCIPIYESFKLGRVRGWCSSGLREQSRYKLVFSWTFFNKPVSMKIALALCLDAIFPFYDPTVFTGRDKKFSGLSWKMNLSRLAGRFDSTCRVPEKSNINIWGVSCLNATCASETGEILTLCHQTIGIERYLLEALLNIEMSLNHVIHEKSEMFIRDSPAVTGPLWIPIRSPNSDVSGRRVVSSPGSSSFIVFKQSRANLEMIIACAGFAWGQPHDAT